MHNAENVFEVLLYKQGEVSIYPADCEQDTGQTHMPCRRVFGRTETNLADIEIILHNQQLRRT